MTIQEMHYDLKQKLNKLDSQQYRNLLVPEIDWVLNEAQELFVKIISEPRRYNNLGFETSQRSIDDIRKIVVTDHVPTITNNVIQLPTNYWHYRKCRLTLSKVGCENTVEATLKIKQHDDEFELSDFEKSSFEWKEVSGLFSSTGIILQVTDFVVDSAKLSYIKKLEFMHNAQDFKNATYNTLNGVNLTGRVNCELADHTHREIVDIAVAIASGQLQLPSYQEKMSKLNFNNLLN